MKYQILDNNGRVEKTILADESFVKKVYPGKYRSVKESQPLLTERKDADKTISEKLDALILALEKKGVIDKENK